MKYTLQIPRALFLLRKKLPPALAPDELRHTCKRVIKNVCMSHGTDISKFKVHLTPFGEGLPPALAPNESCHTYERDMSYVRMSPCVMAYI